MKDLDHEVGGLLTFIEKAWGRLDPELIGRLEKGLGVPIDDEPGRWEQVERKLASDPADAQVDEGFDSYSIVQPVFERLLDEAVAAGPDAPIALPDWTPGERAIVATRVISGEIDNGGASAVFYNGVDGLLSDAIDGLRLLGLEDHANALAVLAASGISKESEDELDELHASWFALPDAEPVRARYITANPGEFRP